MEKQSKCSRPITPRLKHFPPGSVVRLAIGGTCTIGQRKDDRYVWISETAFAGLDCEVVVKDNEYPKFWEMYIERF